MKLKEREVRLIFFRNSFKPETGNGKVSEMLTPNPADSSRTSHF